MNINIFKQYNTEEALHCTSKPGVNKVLNIFWAEWTSNNLCKFKDRPFECIINQSFCCWSFELCTYIFCLLPHLNLRYISHYTSTALSFMKLCITISWIVASNQLPIGVHILMSSKALEDLRSMNASLKWSRRGWHLIISAPMKFKETVIC